LLFQHQRNGQDEKRQRGDKVAWPQTVATIPGVIRNGKEEIYNYNAKPEDGFAAPGALVKEQDKSRYGQQQERR
jgi:hypothetical protein